MDKISISEILAFVSPDGQQAIIDLIIEAKEMRGAFWLEHLKTEYPMAEWIVELAANRTADEAFKELEAEFHAFPVWLAKKQIFELHGKLKHEIDRKR